MKKLEDGVHDLFTSENYRNYLKTMSQFHQYCNGRDAESQDSLCDERQRVRPHV
ncbi:MAG: hypothetical protein J5973_01745 [Eubacterium sp.]|nr:hypothetical protein [Eubacterium sp.]